jgi:hypothetical protein
MTMGSIGNGGWKDYHVADELTHVTNLFLNKSIKIVNLI